MIPVLSSANIRRMLTLISGKFNVQYYINDRVYSNSAMDKEATPVRRRITQATFRTRLTRKISTDMQMSEMWTVQRANVVRIMNNISLLFY